jgi:transcriptional regulator GlxA family with amidase domain
VVNAVDEICLAILTSLSEHYLEAGRPPAAPSHVQMERVEQYIVANYQRPLTVEALVEISGVSARSVLRHFLPRHGYTLHDYLARIRLSMAQASLPAYRDEASVASVALRCGFSSVHQFVQAYRNRFGELPTAPLGERPPGRH